MPIICVVGDSHVAQEGLQIDRGQWGLNPEPAECQTPSHPLHHHHLHHHHHHYHLQHVLIQTRST